MNPSMEKLYRTGIDSLCELAQVYHYAGQSSRSLEILNALLRLPELSSSHQLQVLMLKGRILVVEFLPANDKPEQMFATLHKAKQFADETKDLKGIANTLSLLGMAHYFTDLNASSSQSGVQEKYKEALHYHQQALQIRETLEDTRGISESLFHIGTVYERWQQVEEAWHFYTKSFEIADKYGYVFEKSEPSRHFAFQSFIRGDLEPALQHAIKALEFRQQAGFMPFQPLDHLLLSDIYVKKGEFDHAQIHVDQALALAKEMGYRRYIASSLITSGDIHGARQETAQARAAYEEACHLAEELNLPMLVARARQRLGLEEA